MRSLTSSFVIVAALSACTSTPDDRAASDSNDVVGGARDARFPAIGYMLSGASRESLVGPNCGATLIAPRVAVTAAHCLVLQRQRDPGLVFGWSNGDVGTSAVHPAVVALSHPGFSLAGAPRYAHDIAVLVLDRAVEGVTPAAVAATSVGKNARYIGYGRTTPGGYEVRDGYTNERKGTAQIIREIARSRIYTTGVDGGLCWGDSGGPIFDEATGAISGVLSDFGEEPLTCNVGNLMVFTDLTTERAFLDDAIRCSDAADPAQCLGTDGVPDGSCTYPCAVHGYAERECRPANGRQWLCESGCIHEVAACNGAAPPPASCHYTCGSYGFTAGQCQTNATGAWACAANGCIVQVNSCADQTCRYPCATHGYAEHECRVNGSGSWLCENGCIAQVSSCAP